MKLLIKGGRVVDPASGRDEVGDVFIAEGKISRKKIAIIHDDVRLEFEDHFVHALRFPALHVKGPRNVVPENVDFSVLGEQFADLSMNVIHKSPPRSLIRGTTSAVGMMPVHK